MLRLLDFRRVVRRASIASQNSDADVAARLARIRAGVEASFTAIGNLEAKPIKVGLDDVAWLLELIAAAEREQARLTPVGDARGLP